MQNGTVADGAIGAYGERRANVSMQHATILNIGTLAHGDPFIVAAQNSIYGDSAFYYKIVCVLIIMAG